MVILHYGHLRVFEFRTFTPPRFVRARDFRFQYETLRLHHIEEQFADEIGGVRVGHFQTRSKSVTKKQIGGYGRGEWRVGRSAPTPHAKDTQFCAGFKVSDIYTINYVSDEDECDSSNRSQGLAYPGY